MYIRSVLIVIGLVVGADGHGGGIRQFLCFEVGRFVKKDRPMATCIV